MLGYKLKDIEDMMYGISQADLLINSDENPAIHNYLVMAEDFFEGLLSEGHFE